MNNEQRFVEIETKVAYQEDTIMQLNEVIIQQQQQIDYLKRLSEQLLDRVNSMSAETDVITAQDEKPPHY